MERWCWENFQCRGVLQIWVIVGQGPTTLAVGAVGVVCTFFSPLSFLFSFTLSLLETARYRLKYCLKGPLSPKQPTNQRLFPSILAIFLNIFSVSRYFEFLFKTVNWSGKTLDYSFNFWLGKRTTTVILCTSKSTVIQNY